MTAITHVGLAVPKYRCWDSGYWRVLYVWVMRKNKYDDDLLDNHAKKMRNAHLMSDN
ncbi:hypothetical protein J7J00_18800 [Bacillus sp. ISL-4]|uniref:hypothetical protein n=1 Tax=Bacillus sp. ISL-4 TaxID=2819125 RepID=UPI001BEBEA79|nr:hypothetical protein [Bacillus sp. ISL-4]MBT2667506.1 hypothetical protein [Bacillus sp. ISL-4]MBT2672954.1 hypothetical protein [Streptomyces sp. ISL-14]